MKTELCKTMTKYGSDKGNNIQHDNVVGRICLLCEPISPLKKCYRS